MTTPRRILAWSSYLLVLAGLAALTWCTVSVAHEKLYQEQGAAALNREILVRHGMPAAQTAPKLGALLGRINIPRLRVSSVIMEGDDG